MANKRFIDFPIATTVGDNDIILIWQGGANKQTTKATILSGVPDSLNDLTDVTISGLTNGQILRYDSVTGQWENTDQGNLDLNDLNDVTIVSPTNGQVLVYNSSTSKWENSSGGYVPYVGAVTTVNLGAQSIQAGSFVKQSGTSSQFLKADGSVDSTAYGTGSVTSVGLTMPSAFNVANSPVTTAGTLAVTGAGTVAQYIRGDGSLADFPESSGGGSSVSYYLNGSVDQGTIGGIAYKELSKVPILGAGTDFTINADGYIASFITDAGDPSLLEIPGGNWNFETYFSASSSGGTPTFYVELYKVSGTTATLIASSSSAPELIAFGTNLTPYFSSLAVPTTTLALTDRLAVRYYVTHSGRTITMHTENNHLCQIVTTFTTGITALNGLTAQVQNFAVGTTGTDFNIASATATHTFNLPTASATNRGALSSADWSLFTQAYNDKINSASVTGTTTKTLTLTQQDGGTITASWSDLNTDAVLSVFGRTGAVVAANGDYTTAQVTESGNLYYTDARSRAALSFAAGSGAYNTSTGVITIPTNNNQIINGAGYITSAALAGYLPLSGGVMTGPITTPNGTFGIVIGDDSRLADRNIANTLFVEGNQNNDRGYINFSQTSGNDLGAINGGNLTWRGNTVWHSGNINPVTSVTASSPLASSGGTNPNITIQQASGSQSGFLSSTDWTTFNNKQNALTNPVTGTGTTNYLPKFTGSTTIGNSAITDDGATVNIISRDLTITRGSYSAFAFGIDQQSTFAFGSTNGRRVAIIRDSTAADNGLQFGYDTVDKTGIIAGSATSAGAGIDFYTFNGSAWGNRARVTASGNILVGTTTDNGARLQVSGEGRFYQPLTNTTSYLTVENNRARNAAIRLKTTVGDFYLGTGIGADVNQFQIFDGTAGANRLTIASTGAATFSSSVTASGTISTTAGFGILSGGGGYAIGPTSTRGIIAINGSGDQILTFSTQSYIYNSASLFRMLSSSDIDFVSGGLQRLFISSSTGAATFSSSVNVGGVSSNTDFRIYRTVAPSVFFSISAPGGTPNTSTLGVNGTDVMVLNASGNVGIGTSSPSFQLHVNRAGNTGIFLSNTTGNAAGYLYAGGLDGLEIQSVDSSNSTAKKLMLEPYGGNVLIGTQTDNGNRLQVSGAATVSGDILVAGSFNPYTSTNRGNITLNGTSSNILAFTNNSTARGYIFHNGTDMEVQNVSSGTIRFFVASGEAFRVNSGRSILTYADLAVGGKINGFDLTTLAPTGTNFIEWRLGRALVATSVVTEDRWIRVQLGNRIYDILAIDRGLA